MVFTEYCLCYRDFPTFLNMGPGALDFGKNSRLGKLDQKKCQQVIYILTFKFRFEAIMAGIGKQENGNFKFTYLGKF